MSDRALDSLSSDFQPIAFALLARLIERQVPCLIVQTSRTVEEQKADLASGASGVRLSKHLPRVLRMPICKTDLFRADAMDIVPYDVYDATGRVLTKLAWSDSDNPQHVKLFAVIGEEAEKLGLRWGGRWSKPHDPGHVEYLFPGELYGDIPETSAAFAAHGFARHDTVASTVQHKEV